ncbi:MAG TPA: hypothetical protein VLT36_21900 [Candidatus Dormibacteraeota bacterium]|nr:hypothetical protein [Candidatus Dormibacteraeota bacterium]
MSQPNPPPPLPTVPPATPVVPPRSGARWPLYGCGALVALALIIAATAAITIWWIQRPIKPVVLSPKEKAVVDQKLNRLQGGTTAAPGATQPLAQGSNSNRETKAPPPPPGSGPEIDDRNLRIYVPGSKVLKLTEREVNGLLNQNTDLGKSVRLEFAQDAINAYLAIRIPDDFPIGGGKMFRARGRFRVSIGNGGEPYAILDDVSVFGLSLPKAWLGGIKGENLLGQAIGEQKQWRGIKGVKSLRVEPGALVLEVED